VHLLCWQHTARDIDGFVVMPVNDRAHFRPALAVLALAKHRVDENKLDRAGESPYTGGNERLQPVCKPAEASFSFYTHGFSCLVDTPYSMPVMASNQAVITGNTV
jgi:hypothetical protein